MWTAAALCASYTGFTAIALAMARHHRTLAHREPGPALKRLLRIIGAAFIAGAFAACVPAWGWAIGPVAWFGVLSVAALAFVFLFALAPRVAAALATLGAVGAPVLAGLAA
jgi:hypothetical protein